MLELMITEPWEFGTYNGNGPFSVEVKEGSNNSWLIIFNKYINFKQNKTRFLLGKFQNQINEAQPLKTRRIQLAYIGNLNESNFRDYDFDDVRSNFLKGEINATSRM